MADNKKPILCLDFDGVIHAYTSGWRGIDVIPDGPVPGAVQFIAEAQRHFTVAVYSARSETHTGIDAMKTALAGWIHEELGDGGVEVYKEIEFPTTKLSAFVTIDDRAVTFVGRWPDLLMLREFRPWNKCTSGEMQRSLAELTRPADMVEWASIPSILNQDERTRLERTLGTFARAVQMTQRITDHQEARLYLQHVSADIVGLVDQVSNRLYSEYVLKTTSLTPAPLRAAEVREGQLVTASSQTSPVMVGDRVRQKVFAIVEDIQARGGNIDEAQDAADRIIELLRPSGTTG